MILRRADSADLELLRRWDEQAHVIASDPNDDWGWERELGFRFVEPRRFGNDECFVYRLERSGYTGQ